MRLIEQIATLLTSIIAKERAGLHSEARADIDEKAQQTIGKRPALSTLNQLLESFLHNPIFSDTGEIDLELAARARRDLDSIVVLSEKVRKNAEKRSKTSSKSP